MDSGDRKWIQVQKKQKQVGGFVSSRLTLVTVWTFKSGEAGAVTRT